MGLKKFPLFVYRRYFIFLGPKCHSLRLCHLEPKKVSIHGPNRPRNEKNPPKKIMHGAVKFIGALIVNLYSIHNVNSRRADLVVLWQGH